MKRAVERQAWKDAPAGTGAGWATAPVRAAREALWAA